MWVFLLLLAVVFALLIRLGVGVAKVSFNLFSKWITYKPLVWGASLIPLGLLIIGLVIDTTNAITVDIYASLIILLTKLAFKLIEKVLQKQISEYVVLITGIVLSVIVLSYSYYKAYHVVQTNYQVVTAKEIGMEHFRIVQVADSHIGTTMDGKKFSKYMEDINQLNPDIVVITGDFVDDGTKYEEMLDAAMGLGSLQTKYGVYYVYGNHDKGYYQRRNFQDSDMQKALKENHVMILEDEKVDITNQIVLIGRQDIEVKDRATAEDLVKEIPQEKYSIMLDHQPRDYDNESKAKLDLVLSGHTHGGQMFPLGQLGVLLKANDFMYGKTKRNNTTFIVTSGISDWAMKFKLGAKSEYVVIDVIKGDNTEKLQ